MTTPDLAALAQQILDQAQAQAEALQQQARAAADRLQSAYGYGQQAGLAGVVAAPAGPPPADDELVRKVLADPELRKQVVALLARPAAPGG